MKKTLLLFTIFLCGTLSSQSIYSESFGSLSLSTYTSGSAVANYTTLPTGFELINDGRHNSSNNNNAPFNVPALKTSGWAVLYNSMENDTFLVSTSWLDTAQTVSRWIITPPISNITATTVFTWLGKSPDASFPESYEVYATNKTGVLTANDFSIGDKLLTVNAEANQWTRHSVNLSAYAGQTLRFAFKNISNDKFQIWIDDIAAISLPHSLDCQLNSLSANKYFLTNTSQTISVQLQNNGASSITSLSLNYTYGSSGIISQTYTFTGLGFGETAKLTIPQTYAISTAGNYPLKVWLSGPNNSNDQNNSNDTLKLNVTAQSSSPQKNLLIEQFVSAMNGESVDAQEKLKALESSSVIVVNVHDNDSLEEAGSGGILAYRKQFATAIIDRAYDDSLATFAVSRSYYNNRIQKHINAVTPASVSIINKSYDSQTRLLTFTLKADFTGDAKGDYRFNAYLTERHVHGPSNDTTVNGYNQLSNYYNVPWSPYYQQGYFSSQHNSWVLNSSQYKHHNTFIHSLDQSFGSSGVIPQNGGTAGQSYQQTFTLTVPTSTNGASIFNADNIYIVGFVNEFGSTNSEKRIINAVQEKLTAGSEIVGLEERAISDDFNLYPNPARDYVYISSSAVKNLDIKVYDVSGKLVNERKISGTNVLVLSTSELKPGVYFVTIHSEKGLVNRKLVIAD